MSRLAKALVSIFGLGGLVAALIVVPGLAASAVGAVTTTTCSGTLTAPGVLTGTFPGNVIVKGFCEVNAGQAVVTGNLTIAPGGGVVAAFALNDKTHSGFSSLTVKKNVVVGRAATLILGCEPNFFTCVDDNGKPPTLQSRGTIGGSLLASAPLGVLVHNSTIAGLVTETGGGGGLSCTPTGIFKLFNSPVFSDYEDNILGDSVSVTQVHSCWLGLLRNTVFGTLTFSSNKMADPDANEVLHNYVNRSLTCQGNVPAVQYGDSGSSPNAVHGAATGQCSFSRLAPNPAPNGPLSPIAVKVG
jgi:hypothetical protein